MFFYPEAYRKTRLAMCEFGRMMWQRRFVDGNGGNIVVRVGRDKFLCTPTLTSKGRLRPKEISLVNANAEVLMAGTLLPTSEVRAHLCFMRDRPDVNATVHSHPPFATAYAICHRLPDVYLVPEAAVFCKVALAFYADPGTWELGRRVAESAGQGANVIFMANHGIITGGATLETAYHLTENAEATCEQGLLSAQLAAALQSPVLLIPEDRRPYLLEIQKKLGI